MESSRSEIHALEEQFHALFVGNVAGTGLATPEGMIVDCNDVFASMYGFDSRAEVLARTAWDFYFDRADREAFISPLRVIENYSAEEGVFRHRSGRPVCVMNTRIVARRNNDRPELILSTSVDITEQKRLEKRVRELSKSILNLPEPRPDGESHAFTSSSAKAGLALVFEELGALLRRVNESLRPGKIRLFGRSDAQDFILIVERMKVLVEQLEILRLTNDPGGET
jgi:PAS domain S-box-containing protein